MATINFSGHCFLQILRIRKIDEIMAENKFSDEELNLIMVMHEYLVAEQKRKLRDCDIFAKRRHIGMWRPYFPRTANGRVELEKKSRGLNDISSFARNARTLLDPDCPESRFYRSLSSLKNTPKAR
jgi:hypothetical protein